jgi:hypothetical protein
MTTDNVYGTIVNDVAPNEELEELEKKIELLQMSRINLRVAPNVFDKLYKLAEFKNQSIEDYCVQVLTDSLNVNVGTPTISAPTFGNPVAKKVTAPMGLVERA